MHDLENHRLNKWNRIKAYLRLGRQRLTCVSCAKTSYFESENNFKCLSYVLPVKAFRIMH